MAGGVAGLGAPDPTTLTRRIRAAVDEAHSAVMDQAEENRDKLLDALLPGTAPTPSPSAAGAAGLNIGGSYFVFTYQGQTYKVNLDEVQVLFTVGSVVMVQAFDPRQNPQSELWGLPASIQKYILSLGILRPGRYEYQLNLIADVADLRDFVYDSAAPGGTLTGQTGGGNFKVGNSVKTYQTKPIPAHAYHNLTGFFDNETNEDATANLLGSYDPNGATTAPLGTAATAKETVQALGQDLNEIAVPYVILQFVFATAPTSGYLRLLPFAKRGG
jgi:hypothetical protein